MVQKILRNTQGNYTVAHVLRNRNQHRGGKKSKKKKIKIQAKKGKRVWGSNICVVRSQALFILTLC